MFGLLNPIPQFMMHTSDDRDKVGALLVMDGDKLLSVSSETDYTRKIILKGLTSMHTSVKVIMTKRVLSVQLEQDIEECIVLMTEKRTGQLS